MNNPLYDTISEFYLNFVHGGLEDPSSIFHLGKDAILALIGDVRGKSVCDLACGEGYFSRTLLGQGAHVTGIDISNVLLEHARTQAGSQEVTYIQDDAQALVKLADNTFDIVVCNLAFMDIPDIDRTFQAIHRILRVGGCLAFAILHPCFESPFKAPESTIEVNMSGEFVACRVMNYLEEGYWNSGGDGMRGRVGAYHRTISTYVRALIASGFQVTDMTEPSLARGDYADLASQKNSRIPPLLVIKAVV